MRRMAWSVLCAAAAALPITHAAEEKPADSFEKLLAQLKSDDFESREAATKAIATHLAANWDACVKALKEGDEETRERMQKVLTAHSEDVWEQLRALAEGPDGDLKKRARKAMAGATLRLLPKLLEAEEAELKKRTEEWQDARAKTMQELEGLEKQKEGPEKKADASSRQAELKTAMDKRESEWRVEQNRMQSRVDQIKQAMQDREPEFLYSPEKPNAWRPELVSFEKRLKLKVSVEFVDTPVDKALAQVSACIGLPVELDPKCGNASDLPPISLRVTNMEATLALEWVGKLAELEVRVDEKTKKIVLGKKASLE
ncbi:MAG: hypothetical protein HY291_14105 [Planctomycetes bacterium]|nr:hypothetical protein [Planctomycetota bacterium]